MATNQLKKAVNLLVLAAILSLTFSISKPLFASPLPPPPENEPPEVAIIKPAPNSKVPFNEPVKFEATTNDPEDGPNCCTIQWSSSKDGPLGSGKSITVTFNSHGPRTISCQAKDAGQKLSIKAMIQVNVTKTPPVAKIIRPSPAKNKAFLKVPFILEGEGTDIDAGLNPTLPCPSLHWIVSPVDPQFPFDQCNRVVTFTSKGPRTLTLTAKDSFGGPSSPATAILEVVDPPPGPPVVVILEPLEGEVVDFGATDSLKGFALDPEGKTPLTYKWTLTLPLAGSTTPGEISTTPNLDWKTLGTNLNMSWKPIDYFNLQQGQTKSVKICLYATDPDGKTGYACVKVAVLYHI